MQKKNFFEAINYYEECQEGLGLEFAAVASAEILNNKENGVVR